MRGGPNAYGYRPGLNREHIATPSQRKRELGAKRQSWNSLRPQNEWSGDAVLRILQDERYTGKLIGIKTTRMELGNQNSSQKRAKEDWIVVPDAFESIVTQARFDTVRARLSEMKRIPQKRKSTPVTHLFSRKLKCGTCGLALQRHETAQGVYYGCEGKAWNSGEVCRSIRFFEKDLTYAVLASIRFQAQLAQKEVKRLKQSERSNRRKRDMTWENKRRIQMKLDQISAEKAQAFLQYDRGALTQREFDQICARLEQVAFTQRKQLQDLERKEQLAHMEEVPAHRGERDTLVALRDLRTLDRATVEKLIHHIRVYDGNRIEICWNFGDSSMQSITKEEHSHEGK